MAQASNGKFGQTWRERFQTFKVGVRSWLITFFMVHWISKTLEKYTLKGNDRKRCDVVRKQFVFGILLLFAFDPFELQESTLKTSGLVADRLHAALYTAPAADRIAVVLVDEASLQNTNWPPPFPFWTDLTGMVMMRHPAAIYLDISFDYPRASFSGPEDGPALPDSVRAADEAAMFASEIASGVGYGRVPVVLGSVGKLAALRPPLSGCPSPARDGERTSVISVLACAATETDFYDFPRPPDERGYPLWTEWTQPGGGYVISRTPAAAMAALSCQVLQPAPRFCAASGVGWLSMPGMMSKPSDYGVIPRWSFYTNDEASPPNEANESACKRNQARSWSHRYLVLGETFLSEALAGPLMRWKWQPLHLNEIQNSASTTAEPCLPFPVISAAVVMNHSGKYAQAVGDLLYNRIVLIGDGRRYSPDFVQAPLHQTLPGVILQATVLETLLDKGKKFPAISDAIRARDNDRELTAKLVILLLAILMDSVAEAYLAKKKQQQAKPAPPPVLLQRNMSQTMLRPWKAAWGFYCSNKWNIPFAATAFGGLFLLLWLGWEPANWVFLVGEILLLALGLGELDRSNNEGDDNDNKTEREKQLQIEKLFIEHETKGST